MIICDQIYDIVILFQYWSGPQTLVEVRPDILNWEVQVPRQDSSQL